MKRRLPVLALSLGLLLTGCEENIAAEIVENATLFPAPEAGEGVLGGLKDGLENGKTDFATFHRRRCP